MPRPLRVLLSFPMRLGVSGIGTTAWYEATELAKQGVEVDVIAGSVERDLPGVRVVGETMRIGRAKIPFRALGQERAFTLHDVSVARHLRRAAPRYDVLHAWPGGSRRALEAARTVGTVGLLERPNAHTGYAMEVVRDECHRIGFELAASSPHAYKPDVLASEQQQFDAADALLCPSDFVAETHAARGMPRDRLLRHRYGFDPAHFTSRSRRPNDTGDRAVTVAFVGRLEPRKGVHLLLDAWRRAELGSIARLVLAGPVERGYERILSPLLDQPGVETRGLVTDPSDLMRQTDVLSLPSFEEGSALVTYEARACGAVLAVSDRTGAYAAASEVSALVHPAGDVAVLTDHLARLTSDRDLLHRLRRATAEQVPDLTWEAGATQLAAALAGAIERFGHRRVG